MTRRNGQNTGCNAPSYTSTCTLSASRTGPVRITTVHSNTGNSYSVVHNGNVYSFPDGSQQVDGTASGDATVHVNFGQPFHSVHYRNGTQISSIASVTNANFGNNFGIIGDGIPGDNRVFYQYTEVSPGQLGSPTPWSPNQWSQMSAPPPYSQSHFQNNVFQMGNNGYQGHTDIRVTHGPRSPSTQASHMRDGPSFSPSHGSGSSVHRQSSTESLDSDIFCDREHGPIIDFTAFDASSSSSD